MKIIYRKKIESSRMFFVPYSDSPCAIASAIYDEKGWFYEVYRFPELVKIFEYETSVNCRIHFFSEGNEIVAIFYSADDTHVNRVTIIQNNGTLINAMSILQPTKALVLRKKLYFYQETESHLISFYSIHGNLVFSIPQRFFCEYENNRACIDFDEKNVYILHKDKIYIFDHNGGELWSTNELPISLLLSKSEYEPHIFRVDKSIHINGMTPDYSFYQCKVTPHECLYSKVYSIPTPMFDLYRYAEYQGNVIVHGSADTNDDKVNVLCSLFNMDKKFPPKTIFSRTTQNRCDSYLGEIAWLNSHNFVFRTATSRKSNISFYSMSHDMKKCKAEKIVLPGFIMGSDDIICLNNEIYILLRCFEPTTDSISYEIVAIEMP